jgi:hypothetical protein
MLADFSFHHIGIAVHQIDKTVGIYLNSGFSKTETIIDPVQNVRICFLKKENTPLYELIEPLDEASPVSNILKKTGVSPYHICYEVPDLNLAIANLKLMKYIVLQSPVPAKALDNRKISFLFHKDTGLIELLEKEKTKNEVIHSQE